MPTRKPARPSRPAEMAKAMESMYAYQDALTKAGAFVVTIALAPT